jgi:uroporphyrinogen-III synthase
MPKEPTSIGRRTPTRSDSRPAATLNQIGRKAYSPISVPTIRGEAPIDNAYSDTVTRLPASTE